MDCRLHVAIVLDVDDDFGASRTHTIGRAIEPLGEHVCEHLGEPLGERDSWEFGWISPSSATFLAV